MEGLAKQGLRRYAHGRGDVYDCGTDAAGNVNGAALRIMEGRGGTGLAGAAA